MLRVAGDVVRYRVRAVPGLAVLLGTLLAHAPAAAQSREPELGSTPGSHMHALLQRTVFKVDVLTVDLCFDAPTGSRIAGIAVRGRHTGSAADSVTRAALSGQVALARVEFLRDIPLRDFLEGVGEDLGTAVAAGLVPDSVRRALVAGLPGWYAPLQRRGIRKGDLLVYELQPTTVRTVFLSAGGEVLLDRTEEGRARRNSPLATWLAPGSQFRAGLLQSLQRQRVRSAPPAACSVRLPARKMTRDPG